MQTNYKQDIDYWLWLQVTEIGNGTEQVNRINDIFFKFKAEFFN
jgi:hypothetical protein